MAKVKHYRTNVSGRVPAAVNVEDGQIAINTADEQLLIKNSSGQIVTVQAKISADERNTVEKGADKGLFVPLAVDQETGWPDLRPSFQCNFEMARALSSKITFSRTGTSTYIDDSGVLRTAGLNVPVVEGPGLRLRPAETNLVFPSEDFSVVWTKNSATITAGVPSPDGVSMAQKLVADTTPAYHRAARPITAVVGTTYTFSLFAKAGEPGLGTYVGIFFLGVVGSSLPACSINLETGAVWNRNSSGVASADYLGNGWYRLSFTAVASSVSVTALIAALDPNDTIDPIQSTNYAGDGVSGPYIWGAQINAGDPIPYIPTTSDAVTRPADNAVIQGADFASVWNPMEGAIVVDVIPQVELAPNGNKYLWLAGSNTPLNYFGVCVGAGSSQLQLRREGGGQPAVSTTLDANYAPGKRYKVCVAWEGPDLTVVLDGAKVADIAYGFALDSSDRLILGSGLLVQNAAVSSRRLTLFTRRPSDAQMEAMTS